MMTTLPLAAARARLSALVESAATTHERFDITRQGRRAAVLLSAEDYDSLLETMAVLGDAALLDEHREGLRAVAGGDLVDADQLRRDMEAAGRLRR